MVVACENIRFSSLFVAEDTKSEEKRMFSQARMVVSVKKIQKFCYLAKTIWDTKIPTRTPSHQEM